MGDETRERDRGCAWADVLDEAARAEVRRLAARVAELEAEVVRLEAAAFAAGVRGLVAATHRKQLEVLGQMFEAAAKVEGEDDDHA